MEVLDCPKEIEPLLANLGRVHSKYEDESRGFRPCLWFVGFFSYRTPSKSLKNNTSFPSNL